MTPMEHPLHLRQTEAFIAQNPIDITLTRYTKVKTSAGGYITTSRELDEQEVRLVGSNLVGATQVRLTSSGETVVPRYSIVAMPGTDIATDDTFEHDGQTFEVVTVETTPPWRLVAQVVERG